MNRLTDALTTAIAHAHRKRVSLEVLVQAACDTDSSLLTATDRRDRLADALTDLADDGVIRLPAGKNGWDCSALPELPQWVERIQPRRPKVPSAPARGWVPELDDAAQAIRSTAERRLLERINDFLRDGGRDREPIPLRERSYELFGDEKKLDTLQKSRLVRAGALSIARHLRAFATPPPLHIVYMGEASWVLVVENAATFASLRRVLDIQSQLDPTVVGSLAYGAGNLVTRSIAFLAELDESVTDLWYFGDLDAKGLEIAQAATKTALDVGLPPMKPAVALYSALLERPARVGRTIEHERAAEAVAWLPRPLSADVKTMLTAGRWLPQEALALPDLRDVLSRYSVGESLRYGIR